MAAPEGPATAPENDPAGPPGLHGARRADRLARLESLLQQTGTARLEQAAQWLGVSSMTLRRDLARPGHRLALLGGHVVPAAGLPRPGDYALELQQDLHAAAKRQAAAHAARLVADGDTIFVDCGTTMPHLVESLPAGPALTIVCYALNIANLASRRPQTRLVLLGGLFHPASATFASDEALASLRRLRLNKAFLSAGGVDAVRGVTCTNFNEVPVKQVALASAAEALLVVDGSKLGQLKPAYFAPVTAFSRILTDAAPLPGPAAALAAAGCRLDAAPAAS